MAAFSDHFSSTCPPNYPYTQCCFHYCLLLNLGYFECICWHVCGLSFFFPECKLLLFHEILFFFSRDSFNHTSSSYPASKKYMYLKILVDVSLLYGMYFTITISFGPVDILVSEKLYYFSSKPELFYVWTIFRF